MRRQCSNCKYDLTYLFGRWSCDCCEGKYPKPIPFKETGFLIKSDKFSTDSDTPVGMRGEELKKWMINSPYREIKVHYIYNPDTKIDKLYYDNLTRKFMLNGKYPISDLTDVTCVGM